MSVSTRSISTTVPFEKIVSIVASLAAGAGFFLTWITNYAMGIVITSTDSGFNLATMVKSHASGLPGWPYWITLLAAIACLVQSTLAWQVIGGSKRLDRARIITAIIGLLPLVLLKIELDSWSNVGFKFGPGLWLVVLGFIVILAAAIWNLAKGK